LRTGFWGEEPAAPAAYVDDRGMFVAAVTLLAGDYLLKKHGKKNRRLKIRWRIKLGR
jgi:hypothetical protein